VLPRGGFPQRDVPQTGNARRVAIVANERSTSLPIA
jgi:hypothetical protein